MELQLSSFDHFDAQENRLLTTCWCVDSACVCLQLAPILKSHRYGQLLRVSDHQRSLRYVGPGLGFLVTRLAPSGFAGLARAAKFEMLVADQLTSNSQQKTLPRCDNYDAI
jgi:hypothetical protein